MKALVPVIALVTLLVSAVNLGDVDARRGTDDAGSEGQPSEETEPNLEGSTPVEFPDGDADGADETIDVTGILENRSEGVSDFGATEESGRDDPVLVAIQPPPPPPCAEMSAPYVRTDPDTGEEISSPGFCVAELRCAGERIDDLWSGDMSGLDEAGNYAEFLGEVIGELAGDLGPVGGPLDNAGSVNDFLLDSGLADRPDDEALPVFYYCRRSDTDLIERHTPTNDPNYPGINFLPRFGWDTSFRAEYDIDRHRDDLYDELTVKLGLWNPKPATIPPIENGFTYIHFPTWLWLENPLTEDRVWARSDLETIQIDVRAVLNRVEWRFADDLLLTCAPDDMVEFIAQLHDPHEDAPKCHHRFRDLDTYNLSVTIFYDVQQRVSYRLSNLIPFDPSEWQTHPNSPVDLSVDIGDFGVHQIVSVNSYDE